MIWLPLTIPVLGLAALYTAHRMGVCYACAATIMARAGVDQTRRRAAFRPLVEAYGYALLTVAFASAAGFVGGRIL